jgi:hypothetical protein
MDPIGPKDLQDDVRNSDDYILKKTFLAGWSVPARESTEERNLAVVWERTRHTPGPFLSS